MRSNKARVENSTNTRTAILNATEQIMLEEGYAAVSCRKVASAAGLKSQLLHYYFRSMDDLFIAVFQRMEDEYDEHFARAIASDFPLRELWKLSMDAASTSLINEFKALATHRKVIRSIIARSDRRDRRMHAAAFTRMVERRNMTSEGLSPMILALLMTSVSRMLVTEAALGVSDGHAEMFAFVEHHLRRIESLPREQTLSSRRRLSDDPGDQSGEVLQAPLPRSRQRARPSDRVSANSGRRQRAQQGATTVKDA